MDKIKRKDKGGVLWLINYAFKRIKILYNSRLRERHNMEQGIILLIAFTILLGMLEIKLVSILISDLGLIICYYVFICQKSIVLKFDNSKNKVTSLISSMILPTLIFTIVLYFVLDKEIFKNILTTLVGGIIPIIGGFLLAREQIIYNEKKDKEKDENQKKQTLMMLAHFLGNEININSIRLASDNNEALEVKEWENLKYKLIFLLDETEFNENMFDIVEVYENIYEYNEKIKSNQIEIKGFKSELINKINQVNKITNCIANKIS